MTTTAEALALMDAEIATLVRVVDAPDAAAVGFGSDLDCVTDCTDDFAELDGDSPRCVAQSLMRRLNCPRGANPDDPDYGIWLPGYVNRGVEQAELRELNGSIVGECRKDDRVSDLRVQLSYDPLSSQALTGSMQITPEDPALGDFSLTFSVTGADVLLETIT